MFDSQLSLMSAKLGARKDEYKSFATQKTIYTITFFIVIFTFFYTFININRISLILALPCAFILIISFITFGVTLYRDANVRVFVHEHGMIYQRHKITREVHWSQISFVWHMTTRTESPVNHSYRLECMDGSKIKLRSMISRIEELGKTIEIESARFLIPAVQESFNAGQTVAFGNLLVHQAGLNWRNNQILWQEIQSFEIDESDGRIKIKKHGQILSWATIPTGKVPNVEVLKMIVSPYIAG